MSRFPNVQFATILRGFANVFSRFANVVKLLKCIDPTIYQICLKIFSLAVVKERRIIYICIESQVYITI